MTTRSKVRIRFRKAGDLRFVSHHDLMRVFERMLRRAAIPFRSSEGFHPLPKMVFASALGLGIVGLREVVEIELEHEVPAREIHDRLAAQCPTGMEILAVQTIEPRMKAHCTRAVYRIVIVEPAQLSELPHRVSALLGEAECWVAREKPTHRRVDIRPFIVNLRLEDSSLIMEFHVTPSGSARPDEVLHLLGLGDLLAAGAVLERTELEIEDESCPSAPISASPAACIAEEIVETSLLMAEG